MAPSWSTQHGRAPKNTPAPTLTHTILRYVTDRQRRGQFTGTTPPRIRHILLMMARILNDKPVRSVTRRDMAKWADTRAASVSPATLYHEISTVRTFFSWCVRDAEIIKASPAGTLDKPRMPRSLPRGLRTDAIAALVPHLPDARARLIASLMVQEGLRCMEVAGLQTGDVDISERTLMVTGKGGHQRVLPITDETWAAMGSYQSEARHRHLRGPLIRSESNPQKGLHPQTISKMMTRWMRAAGIKANAYDGVSAHALRHTAATDMLRSGAHVRDVQRALGHASIATTQIYMPFVVNDLRDAMSGRSYARGFTTADEPIDLDDAS